MQTELEEIFEQADNLPISLSIITNPDGSMSSGRYNLQTHEVLLNPNQSQSEFGITFLHELYHNYIDISNAHIDRHLEERNAEQYAQTIYGLYKEEIDEYLKGRGLE